MSSTTGAAGAMDVSQGTQASTTSQTSAAQQQQQQPTSSLTDQSVLDYLVQKGMGSAALELRSKLLQQPKAKEDDDTPLSTQDMKDQMDADDNQARNLRYTLTKSTGGGFGYDRDSAVPIVQWGIPDTTVPANKDGLGETEAQAYLDAFCSLQLWVLTLPDGASVEQGYQDDEGKGNQVLARAKALLEQATSKDPNNNQSKKPPVNISQFVADMIDNDDDDAYTDDEDGSDDEDNKDQQEGEKGDRKTRKKRKPKTVLPPSAKNELLAVTFALLVHTYCELLEVGMETTAHVLRDAFRPVYEPMYGEELQDLFHCISTEDMVKLNTHNNQHMETLNSLKNIQVQVAQYQLKQDELTQTFKHKKPNAGQKIELRKKYQEYSHTVGLLQQKYKDLSARASAAFSRLYDVPFLRRARGVRWHITLSTSAYGLLATFLSSHHASGNNSDQSSTSLLAMSTLLQTKCEIHVEQRDPLPFTPACILEDFSHHSKNSKHKYHSSTSFLNEQVMVNWAAPIPRQEQNVEEVTPPPFPTLHLADEYGSEREAEYAKRIVKFNRAVLVNGFRRLEALERKRDFDSLKETTNADDYQQAHSLASPLTPSILLSTLTANRPSSSTRGRSTPAATVEVVLPSESQPGGRGKATTLSEANWEEAGIGLTCAKLCPPDGRQVAVGCDDAAVRIFDLKQSSSPSSGSMMETSKVLLGHKNGFPVFDLSWNKDGRSLLSCGGDGSVRLWDTMAQGPFGEVKKPASSTTVSKKKPTADEVPKIVLAEATEALDKATTKPEMNVPGLKEESTPQYSGAALAVYKGHAPNTPVWSVAFAPCGYYFASAGGDATARLWTTDRAVPVRIFAGHTSNSVHCVTFHPNCNYVATGSEDRTVRLWDIQTGRCVRLLSGCSAGVHKVEVDPSGRYAAGADAMGTIHLWDLGTGKKVTEFRPKVSLLPGECYRSNMGMVHSMSFSACGTALAAGGDDRCVKIWDVNKATTAEIPMPVTEFPANSFPARRTVVMDLHFTKRNLLLSAGKYVHSEQTATTISD